MKNRWILFFITWIFLSASSAFARPIFGMFPILSTTVTGAPILSWSFINQGIYPGFHDTNYLNNTGTATSGMIIITLGMGNFSIDYLGVGDNCTGIFLTPGSSCSVGIQNDGPGSATLDATDGTVSAPTATEVNCPAC